MVQRGRGVVAEFFRHLYVVQWGGGGVVAGIVP